MHCCWILHRRRLFLRILTLTTNFLIDCFGSLQEVWLDGDNIHLMLHTEAELDLLGIVQHNFLLDFDQVYSTFVNGQSFTLANLTIMLLSY